MDINDFLNSLLSQHGGGNLDPEKSKGKPLTEVVKEPLSHLPPDKQIKMENEQVIATVRSFIVKKKQLQDEYSEKMKETVDDLWEYVRSQYGFPKDLDVKIDTQNYVLLYSSKAKEILEKLGEEEGNSPISLEKEKSTCEENTNVVNLF